MIPRPRPLPGVARLLAPALLALAVTPVLSGQGSGFDSPNFPSNEYRVTPLPVFFPPNPPPLGRAIARAPAQPGRLTAPVQLKSFVNEPFYPQLGSRLYQNNLSEKLAARVDAYRANKASLRHDLTAELERVRDQPAPDRATALTAFAGKQAPALATLETTAEELRRDLYSSDLAWGALRLWKLNDGERRGFSPLEIAQVMRAFAFYQDGLLPAQRQLLREIAIELTMAAESTASATAGQPYLFFPPEPARVLLPDDTPADVAAKVARFETKKSGLKKELYDAAYAQDGQKLGFLRTNGLRAVAEKQAGALKELEDLAEEIRRGLANYAEPAAIAERSPLPARLQDRVASLMSNYSTLQKQAAAQVEAVLEAGRFLPFQATYRFENDALRFLVVPRGPNLTADARTKIEELRQQVSAVADDYGRRVADMINEKDAIRAEIGASAGTARAAAVDQLLLTAMRVATARETADIYRDYRIAVFQPGLSPAQRRLLFDGVIEQLDLPLPRGELQPTRRAETW